MTNNKKFWFIFKNFYPSTTTTAQTKIQCVGVAVSARETAIDTAMTAYTGSLNSAYTARASALQSAYALTTGSASVKAAVKQPGPRSINQ